MNEVDDTANNPLLEFSLKLCAAVKKEKCLYDRNSVRKNTTPDVEAAWDRVAKECNETIDYCKYRWKSMFKSFTRNYKRCNPYYLHEYMLFLKEDDQPGTLNDDTNSIDKFNDDVSRQESEIDTINLDEDARSEADSQTASADEMMNESVRVKDKSKFAMFLEEENRKDDLDMTSFGKRKRSNHKRACKRGLDPKLLSELAEEEDAEEKRPRRSLERPKASTPLNDKETSYKFDSRSAKIKQHNKAEEAAKETFKIAFKRSISLNKNDVNKSEDLQLVDSFTSTDTQYRNAATQCDMSPDTFDNFDEMFFSNLKVELLKMNGRQKMNFKSKIYRALMDVLDDATDFPNSQEDIKCPPSPLLVNANTGELRLMRELVALVQAAKNTPEIVNAKDKITTTNTTTATTNPAGLNKITVKPKSTAEAKETAENGQAKHGLSIPLDEDDDVEIHLSTENLELEEEEEHLPRSLDEIITKAGGGNQNPHREGNVMGIPKHVLQKVVKVAGTNSSTIVAREGDRRRIYRIYPKSLNQMDGRSLSNKNPNSVGTFYVAPTKVSSAPAITTTSTVTNKTHTSPPTISVKNFANKSAHVANIYPASIASRNSPCSNGNAMKRVSSPALYKSVHPSNRILNASTGLFQTATSSPPPLHMGNNSGKPSTTMAGASFTTTTKYVPIQSSMLPPNSNIVPGAATKRPLQVRSTQQTPQIIHRRFSICGPLATEQTINSHNAMQAHSKINKSSNSISQIQISRPVSLNKQASSVSNDKNTEKQQVDEPSRSNTIKDKEKPKQTTSVAAGEEMPAKVPEELPIVETAGTITADSLDPLYVKQTNIKAEPVDD